MDLNIDQPIAALASPPGGSARGIIRVSGNKVRDILAGWFDPDQPGEWNSAKSASSHLGSLHIPDEEQSVKVRSQVLLWPNRRSYTGQPLIELHLPGSPCLLEAVLGETYRRGARPARPGEFTMRAFLAGKLDLLQAEAVLGVIDAQSHVELKAALAQLAGGVSEQLSHLRRDLLELLADLEAGLDFVDEDIEFVSRHEIVNRLASAREFVNKLLQQTGDRMQSHGRSRVVLAGLPNAGKSTLFNRLAGADTALVSSQTGTTRDFLTRAVAWNDLSFDLIDTAGWEDAPTGIEAEAQLQRCAQLEQSDLLIWCSSAVATPEEKMLDNERYKEAKHQSSQALRLLTKIDLISPSPTETVLATYFKESLADSTSNCIAVSAIADVGLSDLERSLRTHLGTDRGGHGQWVGITAARCRETLESVLESLTRAEQAAVVTEAGDELIAVDLRGALEQLGVILGVIYTDDILDRVFSKFCIGK